MPWPPQIGDLLLNGDRAWAAEEKWSDWILASRGHGDEWARVFHVHLNDTDRIWQAIMERIEIDRIISVRKGEDIGVNCTVEMQLTIGSRSAVVRTVWHYAGPEEPPRLVTAFPRL